MKSPNPSLDSDSSFLFKLSLSLSLSGVFEGLEMGDRRGSQGLPWRNNSALKQRPRKPPTGHWKPTIPSWEKVFCSKICLIPWWKVLEAKKIMPLYEGVVQWNDSAGEEAFTNAKKRFWADINGLPCDVSLPDPDIYIDKIDWNSINDDDAELFMSLEQEAVVAEEKEDSWGDNRDNGVLLSSHLGNGPIPCTGWGDEDDQLQPVNNSSAELTHEWIADAGNNENLKDACNSWGSCEFRPDYNAPHIARSGWDDAGVPSWPVSRRDNDHGWGGGFDESGNCHEHNHELTQLSNYELLGLCRGNWSSGNGSGRRRGRGGRYGNSYNKTTRCQSRAQHLVA